MTRALTNRPWLREFLGHLKAGRLSYATRFLGRWTQLRFRRRVIHPVCKKLYRDPHRDIRRSILICGTGRSGTTWLSDIVGAMLATRTMFEPFHPGYVPGFGGHELHHYARPSEEDDELRSFCQTVFSGTIRNPWVDREVGRIFPKYRVIKDIRVNLFLKWIRVRFPELPILFVIRHPCAVVLSRLQGNWATDSQLAVFLSQQKLVEDFLSDRLSLIARAETAEEKHALIWCISNLVPLRQFDPGELDIVFYEDLCLEPEDQIKRILRFLEAAVFEPRDIERSLKRVDTPSTTVRQQSTIMRGTDKLDKVRRWRNQLSEQQASRILSIVDAFGMHFLYGDSDTPIADAWGRSRV